MQHHHRPEEGITNTMDYKNSKFAAFWVATCLMLLVQGLECMPDIMRIDSQTGPRHNRSTINQECHHAMAT